VFQGFNIFSQSLYYNAENLRSDTFDILKTTINLEIGTSSNKFIKGNTQIRFAPKINNRNFIRLDLLKMNLDSVKENNSLRTFVYNDTILRINFSSPKNTIDTSVFTIYYHGIPQIDATNWGGFYFDNTQNAEYAYNLGVGFGAKPHNYGRVWFPCFDNFVERSKYEFNITADSSRRSFCNGQLVSDLVSGNKRTRKWVLNESIPSYLASVSIAKNYAVVNWNINTLNGNKNILLVANAADTSSLKTGFVNLKNCITGFENYFGPYQWNRFGYCVVPFSSGAMEHATNISYPRPFIGSLNYEADLMAHELSHHWWGDLITCQTPEDMWINEGMATFSSYLFLEWQYGKARYINAVKTEHDKLLHTLFKNEGFRAVSGVPHALTYGDHVYKKGADMAHTLRGYMGDTAFFNACKYTMQQSAFKHLNTNDFKNYFQASSGQQLSNYFNNWILGPGWAHFSMDSVQYNNLVATVFIKQKLFGATNFCNNVPLEISFFKNDRSRVVRKIYASGAVSSATVNVPYNAVYAALNYDDKISDATSHEVKILKTTAVTNFTLAKVLLTIQSAGTDSSLIRVIHNYVKPDNFKSNPDNHKLSNQHYWKIEGLLSSGFVSKARFNYDGFKNINSLNGYMDTLLTLVNGDSVQLFYRKNAADDWHLQSQANKVISSFRQGYLEIDTLKLGEYCFGNSALNYSGIKETLKEDAVKIYPTPTKDKLTIEILDKKIIGASVNLISVLGKILKQEKITSDKQSLDVSSLPPGEAFVEIILKNQVVFTKAILIE
jgi:aminopeptidase N